MGGVLETTAQIRVDVAIDMQMHAAKMTAETTVVLVGEVVHESADEDAQSSVRRAEHKLRASQNLTRSGTDILWMMELSKSSSKLHQMHKESFLISSSQSARERMIIQEWQWFL